MVSRTLGKSPEVSLSRLKDFVNSNWDKVKAWTSADWDMYFSQNGTYPQTAATNINGWNSALQAESGVPPQKMTDADKRFLDGMAFLAGLQAGLDAGYPVVMREILMGIFVNPIAGEAVSVTVSGAKSLCVKYGTKVTTLAGNQLDDVINYLTKKGLIKKGDDLNSVASAIADDIAAKEAANAAKNSGKNVLHHSDPKFMGGNPKQTLTNILESDHKQLHADLNNFLKGETDDLGNHMRPQRGNSGVDIQNNFTQAERNSAMAEFYKQFGDKYPDAARDFFNQHPNLR